jgi:zinc protease
MSARRPLTTLALALLLAVAPAAAQARPLPGRPATTGACASPSLQTHQTVAGPIQTFTLPNGLQVVLKENHAAPVVSWVVTYKVGSRDEPAGATGSAHLLEHMLFKGTKTLGKGQIAQLLDRNGASANASTWTDWTNYYETYASNRLELGLAVEAARMRDALILDAERQSEMTVVRNELERGESEPGRVLYQELTSAAYRAHPYHHPTIGWRSDVETVPTSALKRFYDTYYQPNNAVAVLVGDFEPRRAAALIARYFGGIPRGKTPPVMRTTEEPQLGERRFTLRRRGETNMLQMGWHIPAASHPDIGPLLVLDAVMSSGVTGRLYQAIVEQELALGCWTDVGLQKDPSLFRMAATLKPGGSHAEVEAALLAQLEAVKASPITAQELDKAKRQARAAYIYGNEGTEQLASALGYYAAIDRWERNFTLLADIERVTAADVQRVAQAYMTTDNRTVGWYVATPDGPVPPAPHNAGSGKATANGKRPVPAPLFDFERRPMGARALTAPVSRRLANGLTVLVLANPESQTVAIDGHVWAGRLHHPARQAGLATAVATLLDAGTARRTKLQLAADLEGASASLGFTADKEVTNLEGRALAGDRKLLLEALVEALRSPTFPADELAKFKARSTASLRQAEDTPRARLERAFGQALYPEGHPLRPLDLAPTLAGLEGLRREDLQAFHRRFYGPNTTTLVVVGRVEPEQVFAELEALTQGWQAAELVQPTVPTVPRGTAARVVVALPDKTNIEVRVGHPTALSRRSPDYHAAQLGNYVLGGDPLSSRLGLRLRDELGLTYGTYSALQGALGPGPWWASLTVNPANLATGLRELDGVVRGLLAKGVTPQELAFAKSSYVGSQAVGLATNVGMASSLASIALYDLGLDYWRRYPALIGGVTQDQVNRALRAHVHPEAARTVLVGPVPEATP